MESRTLAFGEREPNLRLQGQAIDRHPLLGMVDRDQWPVFVKTGTVIAVEADRAGRVVTLEGEMEFHGGDFIVTDNPPTHAWPVRRDVFERTYAKLDALSPMHEVSMADEVVDDAGTVIPGARIRRTITDFELDADGNPTGEPTIETFVLGER